MGASISLRTQDEALVLRMSNGTYGAVQDVLALAVSQIAEVPWQHYWALWFVSHDLVTFGHNHADYDLTELPWERAAFDEARDFLQSVVDGAIAGLGWEKLKYSPQAILPHLTTLRSWLPKLTSPAKPHGFRPDEPAIYERCPNDGVILHEYGCIVCLNAPG